MVTGGTHDPKLINYFKVFTIYAKSKNKVSVYELSNIVFFSPIIWERPKENSVKELR